MRVVVCFVIAGFWLAGATLRSRDGLCQVTVPTGWTDGALPGSANSADRKTSLTVSSPKMIETFADLKKTAQAIYKQNRVTQDSDREFEMEGKATSGKPDVYRAIPTTSGHFCIVEVTYESGNVDDARKLARTVAPAK